MRFISTRGTHTVSLDDALVKGIADDGGLFVPVELPSFSIDDFSNANSLTDVAAVLLRPFFSDSSLLGKLDSILDETFSFPIPLTSLPTIVVGRRCSSFITGRQPRSKMLAPDFWRLVSVDWKATKRRR